MEYRVRQLNEQLEQMMRLREDNTILTGFKFQTMAGDIRINNQRMTMLMLDCYIKALKEEIIHAYKHEESGET